MCLQNSGILMFCCHLWQSQLPFFGGSWGGRLNEKMKNIAKVMTGVDSFDSFYSLKVSDNVFQFTQE